MTSGSFPYPRAPFATSANALLTVSSVGVELTSNSRCPMQDRYRGFRGGPKIVRDWIVRCSACVEQTTVRFEQRGGLTQQRSFLISQSSVSVDAVLNGSDPFRAPLHQLFAE